MHVLNSRVGSRVPSINIMAALGPLLGSYRLETDLPRSFLCIRLPVFFCSLLLSSLFCDPPRLAPSGLAQCSYSRVRSSLSIHTLQSARTSKTLHICRFPGAHRTAVADHISSRELNFLTTSQKCSPQLPFHHAQIEELALLYRFIPSIPRETFKTHKTRPDVVSFAQLYKFKLVSFAPLSPDDGSARQLPQITAII